MRKERPKTREPGVQHAHAEAHPEHVSREAEDECSRRQRGRPPRERDPVGGAADDAVQEHDVGRLDGVRLLEHVQRRGTTSGPRARARVPAPARTARTPRRARRPLPAPLQRRGAPLAERRSRRRSRAPARPRRPARTRSRPSAARRRPRPFLSGTSRGSARERPREDLLARRRRDSSSFTARR